MFKSSKNPKVEELTKSYRERSYNLSCLLAIKLEELNEKGKPKRMCAWCAEVALQHGNQKYCSAECSDSAMAWAYPQKENALHFLMLRQDWKCKMCQFDYKPAIDEVMARERKNNPYAVTIFWYHLKRLKVRVPNNRKPEVDHIIPVYKGGETLGLDNHQAICYTCHKVKSRIDNSGPRKSTQKLLPAILK
jgi:HNH endonuclease